VGLATLPSNAVILAFGEIRGKREILVNKEKTAHAIALGNKAVAFVFLPVVAGPPPSGCWPGRSSGPLPCARPGP
jgi:hypothetical protein